MNQAKSETTAKDTIDIFDEYMSDSLKEASSQSVPINNISTTDSFAVKESKARLPINQPNYIPGFYKSTVSKYLRNDFNKEISSFKASSGIKTGYPNLDAVIGSLYPGLYVLGAGSSIGKTTFALQLADQLIEAGNPAIYFTLEQSALELVSKSVSRITALNNMNNTNYARSAIQIRKGEVNQEVKDAVLKYDLITDLFTIIEGDFQTDMTSIEKTVEDYVKVTGSVPVIFVDYLQIVQEDTQFSDKSKVDVITKRLKILQRKWNAIIIAISSINRGNYMLPIDFESFKESGSIEYSADVVWGLQLQVLSDSNFASAKGVANKRKLVAVAKAESPRKVELVCLKNRYGIASYNCGFHYYPQFDLFRPDPNFKQSMIFNKRPQIIL